MRIRTGIKPGEWRDEGPSTALGMGNLGGELVKGGPATPGVYVKPVPMPLEDRIAAGKRWNGRMMRDVA